MKKLIATLLCLAALTPARAAADEAVPAVPAPAAAGRDITDLGEGLDYLRVHAVGASLGQLERVMASDRSAVIDLRYTAASASDAHALSDVLARRKPGAALLLLVSPLTPATLTSSLLKLPASALTLGIEGSLPTPAVVVAQPPDVDRRAYDALDGGMPLADLITGRIEKERFDEAELVKEFQNGNLNAAPPPTPDPTKPEPEKAPVLTDRVLQRAVHLHRALAALHPRR